ncbi:MAG: hypothetical protein IJ045_05780 [Ruminiclostridium sp.]|nr:hypothetical protein [Ruminiclostridium sp.]
MENGNEMLDILLSALGNAPESDENSKNKEENESSGFDFSGINIDMILKLGDIMSSLNSTDKDTELLMAIKPYLKEKNQAKMDTAIKLFRLISLLPALKETGIFDNLF